MNIIILAIESSCDDTSAAVIKNGIVVSNVIAGQDVHKEYGGVVPELASRSHQQNIVPVVAKALSDARVSVSEISAVAFTRGPGLLGSLLVGVSFAKGFALAQNCKMIEVNHLHAHVLASFIQTKQSTAPLPNFPFLCLLVSGGHTQIIEVQEHCNMKIIGTTIDDAAGEAFDKCAKMLGLPYPGGPYIDSYAQEGNPHAFKFGKPQIKDYDYSFSGLKTSFLYFLKDAVKNDAEFISKHRNDICASIQFSIVEILMQKLVLASRATGIREIVIGGGVAANSGLRNAVRESAKLHNWTAHIPPKKYTTDNAAMIAVAAYYNYIQGNFAAQDISAKARYPLHEYFSK